MSLKKNVGVAVIAIAAPLGAQWLEYPTAGVPKTKEGKPNLVAPAPTTADGRPDLSGIWEVERGTTARHTPPWKH